MQYKVSELSGALLDAAVAMAEGHGFRVYSEDDSPIGRATVIAWPDGHSEGDGEQFEPSSVWDAGGPIIQRERIHLEFGGLDGMTAQYDGADAFCTDCWFAECSQCVASHTNPLIAAMRAYIASEYGEFVEIQQINPHNPKNVV